MNLVPLPIFPEGSLDSSVITTVWVGVAVLSCLNLSLGWTYSGLVVPGYLVPLLIVKPLPAVAILGEGILAYLLVVAVSAVGARTRLWCGFFGRDRFFTLLLASVGVRLFADGWALPRLAQWAANRYGLSLDYGTAFHSIGLVIVALVANQLWKPGVWRGGLQLGVVLTATFVVVRYGLMELTNFSVGGLEYMYEDLAFSLLASPKSYVILLSTAFVASQLNLRYGWEFSGILIPALLALQWYAPMKIVTSFVEAFAVVLVADLLLRTPLFAGRTVEKAAKTLLFFTVSFGYKMGLAYLLLWLAPEAKTSDFYGLGYLLPSLLALKIHEQGILLRLTGSTLQASASAAALALVIGLLLTLIPTPATGVAATAEAAAPPVTASDGGLFAVIEGIRGDLLASRAAPSRQPSVRQHLAFDRGARRLEAHLRSPHPATLEAARRELGAAGFRLERLDERYWIVREVVPRGWGAYLLAAQPASGPLIEVPRPLEERGALEAAGLLLERLEGRGLAIGQSSTTAARRPGGLPDEDIFATFHRALGEREVLQVRSLGPGAEATTPAAVAGSELWVEGTLPESFRLQALWDVIGPFATRFGRPRGDNVQRDMTWSGFAELFLSVPAARRLLAGDHVEPQLDERSVTRGHLQAWLLGRIVAAPPGAESAPSSLAELLRFDDTVVGPLLRITRTRLPDGSLQAETGAEWRFAAAAAAELGFEVHWFEDAATAEGFCVIAERQDGETSRQPGSYVLRSGQARPFVVAVPRPWSEPGTLEYGITLFGRLKASALLIAGESPAATPAARDEPTDEVTLFDLAHDAVLRDTPSPALVVQVRGLAEAAARALAADVLVGATPSVLRREELDSSSRELMAELDRQELTIAFAGSSPEAAGYDTGSLQVPYLDFTLDNTLMTLRLAPRVRRRFRQIEELRTPVAQLRALDISTREGDLLAMLGQASFATPQSSTEERVTALLARYLESRDVVALRALQQREGLGGRTEHWIDARTRHSYLVLFDGGGRPGMIVNLAAEEASPRRLLSEPLDAWALERALEDRTPVLILRGS